MFLNDPPILPRNVEIIRALEGTCQDPSMGAGELVARVRVTEPGNGFTHAGVWDLVNWHNARGCVDGLNFDDGPNEPYASRPVFIGD